MTGLVPDLPFDSVVDYERVAEDVSWMVLPEYFREALPGFIRQLEAAGLSIANVGQLEADLETAREMYDSANQRAAQERRSAAAYRSKARELEAQADVAADEKWQAVLIIRELEARIAELEAENARANEALDKIARRARTDDGCTWSDMPGKLESIGNAVEATGRKVWDE